MIRHFLKRCQILLKVKNYEIKSCQQSFFQVVNSCLRVSSKRILCLRTWRFPMSFLVDTNSFSTEVQRFCNFVTSALICPRCCWIWSVAVTFLVLGTSVMQLPEEVSDITVAAWVALEYLKHAVQSFSHKWFNLKLSWNYMYSDSSSWSVLISLKSFSSLQRINSFVSQLFDLLDGDDLLFALEDRGVSLMVSASLKWMQRFMASLEHNWAVTL